MTHATAQFHVDKWDETALREGDGKRKLTHATVKQTFKGDIEGEGVAEYLMAYKADGTADFTGLQTIDGKIGGKSGILVLRLSGDFDGKRAKATTQIVEGAGQGGLANLTGKGEFEAPMGHDGAYSLNFVLN